MRNKQKVVRNKLGQFKKKTNQEVVNKLVKIFKNENYDYSKVHHNGNRSDVIIICKKHGEFKRRPEILYKKRGCFSCLLDEEKEKFIKKSKKIHKNKYDYSDAVYLTQKTKVFIKCKNKLHPAFLQSPDQHMRLKTGCPKCSTEKNSLKQRKSQKHFLYQARLIHKKKYGLKKVVYSGAKKKIIVKCRIHGEFLILAESFLCGTGCPQCSLVKIGLKRRKTNHIFIEEAKKVHGDRYDYKFCKYSKAKSPVIIFCKIHGKFSQVPDSHLSGSSCNKCGNETIGFKRRNSVDKVLSILIKKRGKNRFDYPLISEEYKSNRSEITIKCNVHHKYFKQKVSDHENNGGCEDCKFKSHGEELIMLILKEKKINYIHNWNKHDCFLEKGKAKFDFYLPKLNKIIEYDGEQHFKPVQYPGMSKDQANEEFIKRKKFDRIKNQWSKKKKIFMLRIRYTDDIHLKLKNI